MKKLNNKGFTLIELLAVITIMGILMLVAIPAVSRTIENSRRDTFMDTAKAYVNAMKNAVAADEMKCGGTVISAVAAGKYYYAFDSAADSGKDLMEQGGKSSWGSADVKGVIQIEKKVGATTTYEYSVAMVDSGQHGFKTLTLESDLSRTTVKTSGEGTTVTNPAGATACTIVQ